MSSVMPVDEGTQILVVVLTLSVPPMRSDCANPVHLCVSSARKPNTSLSIELPLKGLSSGRRLPVKGVFHFHDKDSSKGEARGRDRQLHHLDDQVGNVAFWVVWKAALWCDHVYVPLNGGEEGRQDAHPWVIPDVLGSRWASSVALEYCTGDKVEGYLRRQNGCRVVAVVPIAL